MMDICEECGFDYDDVSRDDVAPRVDAAVERIVELLGGDAAALGLHPSPDRWSAVEYAAHVRDVLLTIRDRLVIGLVEDDPGFQPLYRDERVTLGLYAADRPDPIAVELAAAATMFNRLFAAIDGQHLTRPVQYGFPAPMQRTVGWMGVQAVHEAEHHLADIEHNLRGDG